MPATYAIGLAILFYVLLVAEFFLPSGGVIGVAAAVTAIASIIIALTHSLTFGLSLLLVMLVTTPIVFSFVVRLWPKTLIGRQMLNRQIDTRSLPPEGPTTLDGVPLADFVGRVGSALCPLLPAGQIIVEGHKVDAISTGKPIEIGTTVKVLRVYSRALQVREATPDEIAETMVAPEGAVSADLAAGEATSNSAGETIGADSLERSRTLEEIDLDKLES